VSLLRNLNRGLDSLAQPKFRLAKRDRSSFRICGMTGYFSAVALASFLIWRQELSLLVLFGVAVVGALTFFTLAVLTKVIMGREALIYYHHEIAVILAAAFGLWLTGQPVLPYLDVTILGLGVILGCGRIGCFMVGCCHGRPHRIGVCYRREHASEGFPSWFVDVRLFPIQLVESTLVFLIVLVGAGLIMSGARPGDALAWYLVAYGVMRFVLEFARGDSGRAYWLGFSEAQWTSLILMTTGACGQYMGVLVVHPWHALATLAIAVSMLAIFIKRRFQVDSTFELLRPDHLREIAIVTARFGLRQAQAGSVNPMPADKAAKPIAIASTSLGIHISASRIQDSGRSIDLFGLSRTPSRLSGKLAGVLAEVICRLRQAQGRQPLVTRNENVHHLIIGDHEPPATRQPDRYNLAPRSSELRIVNVSLTSSGHASD
jgi:prolipoprotein diacylglyceryltransferase